jgi:hypothetical protein
MVRRHPPPPLVTVPLSLAVYRPASLFAMLLIASLAKNTFSLRWLALSSLSGYGYGASSRFGGMNRPTFVWGRDLGRLASSEWDDVDAIDSARDQLETDSLGLSESTCDEIMQSIPRGGASDGANFRSPYSGLINLGNTCYLNAQLQCAYHVPLLRELVLSARDEVIEVEVEVEEDAEVDGQQQDTYDCDVDGENKFYDGFGNSTYNSEEVTSAVLPEGESTTTEPAKKTIIKQEHRPISPALRALQQTFNSLNPNSNQSSGSTQVLCRSLGINPYIQQDGQEFWKLFVPEVDYAKITELYTGYYDDYIREIVPENHNESWEEKKDDDDMMRVEEFQPRERVRTDPFLDLSIPVTEGTG